MGKLIFINEYSKEYNLSNGFTHKKPGIKVMQDYALKYYYKIYAGNGSATDRKAFNDIVNKIMEMKTFKIVNGEKI